MNIKGYKLKYVRGIVKECLMNECIDRGMQGFKIWEVLNRTDGFIYEEEKELVEFDLREIEWDDIKLIEDYKVVKMCDCEEEIIEMIENGDFDIIEDDKIEIDEIELLESENDK